MRALEFITGHVTFKLHYNGIYKMKTTLIESDLSGDTGMGIEKKRNRGGNRGKKRKKQGGKGKKILL